jgi:hypothetical protein
MINGDTINKKLAAPGSLTDMALKLGMSNVRFVDHVYLSAFSRRPTEGEKTAALKSLQEACGTDPQARREALEDFTWAMLTGKEFIFNH